MPRASIKDIAAQTGVSFQTVSKVLKGGGNVSAQTRASILETAQRLGYIPNTLARGLVGQRSSTIGVIVDEAAEYVVQFLMGVEQEGRRRDQGIMISYIDQQTNDYESPLRLLMERRIDGLVLAAPQQLEHNTQVSNLLRDQLPIVSIHTVPNLNSFFVGSQQIQAGRLATEHLLHLEHRRIGVISGPRSRFVTQERLLGYQQALAAADIHYISELVEEGDWKVMGGYVATLRLLERTPDITAIFAHNDLMAIGALRALQEKGLRIPEDCAVVGCDDIPMAAHTFPSLTTIHLPFYGWGKRAMSLLLEVIDNQQREAERILLPMRLIQRASSGKHQKSQK